jgi:thiol-disulfide isomerase/thioredoxin
MNKLLLTLSILLFSIIVSATEIHFLDNPKWATVLEKAKKENKPIFFDAYATWCGPCKQMDADTYTDDEVAKFYNENFINVKYDMEKGEGPMLAERYFVTSYPNLLFIDKEGVLLHRGIGFMVGSKFLALGKTAIDPEQQYYTLKKSATTLDPAKFKAFVAMANQFEDEDLFDICRAYLAKQPDVLANEDLIDLIMAGINAIPDEKTLAYIIANQSKIVSTGKYSASDVEQRLVSLTLGYALYQSADQDNQSVNFEEIKALLNKYVPEQSFFVFHYFKTQFLLEESKSEDALNEFNVLISNTPTKVSFEQLCNAMMSFGPYLAQAEKLDEALKKFDAIPVPAKDAKLSYMRDCAKGIIYLKLKDYEKFKIHAASIIADKDAPTNVKSDLEMALQQIAAQIGN